MTSETVGGPATAAPAPTADPQPRVRERLGYGLGDLASNLTWTTITSYLLFFYTDVALIGAATAGTILFVARALDAIADPAVGLLLDRTQTRFGRARPYLMFGAPVLAVLTVLTFTTPAPGGGAGSIVWAYASLILVGLLYSLVNIPYGALMPMMTRSSDVRMRLSGWRFACASVGLVVVSGLTTPLVGVFGGGDQRHGFLVVVSIFAAIGMVLFWVVAASAKERVPFTPPAQRLTVGASLRTLGRNTPWLAVFVASLIMFARLGVLTGGAIYFALSVMGNPGAIPVILLGFSASALLGSLVTPWVLRRLGHRRGIVIGLLASVPVHLALIPAAGNLALFTALFFVSGIIGGFGFVAAPALVSDTVEYQEHRTGQRNEGLLYAGYSFATKVGTALGGALLAFGLAAIGYRPGGADPAIAGAVTWLYVGLPVVLALLQVVALSFYRLERDLPAIVAANEARRAGESA